MTKIYTAQELAQIAAKPEEVEEKLALVLSRAYERALEGTRHVLYYINADAPIYEPLIQRLQELGYKVTYHKVGLNPESSFLPSSRFIIIQW